jgi:CBS domain containing-hemolysin-like protein
MLQLTIAVIAVLLSSALCSGSEAALFSVSLIKVRQMAQSKKSAALALLAIRQNMSRPIATIVILNNVANIVGSIVVGGIATNVLGSHWLGLFSGILTFLVIIFSEIVPKTLGERYADRIALYVARPVMALTYVLTPLVWLVERITSPITKGATSPTTNEAEIKLLARIGRQEGIIEDDESEMIQQVFKLNDLTAEDLMTPRVAMTYLRGHLTLAEVQEDIIASPHSRIVVTGETIDDVLGVALKDELLTAIIQGKGQLQVSKLIRDVKFIPETVRADTLLTVFRKARQLLAVVIDEYGGVAGVVTLEDVLETLTGEIIDETDLFANLRAAAKNLKHVDLTNGETSTG